MNLRPSSNGNGGRRPSQQGRVFGPHGEAPVEWVVDTGADLIALRQSVGAPLGGIPIALGIVATTGDPIQAVAGLSAEFEVEAADGSTTLVRVRTPMALKDGDTGSDVLGMEPIAAARARLSWDPLAGVGSLRR